MQENTLFTRFVRAIDTDEFRRQISPTSYETLLLGSDAHHATVVQITSGDAGPLTLVSHDGQTGTKWYSQTIRAMDTQMETEIVRYDRYLAVDAAHAPLKDAYTPLVVATVIITGHGSAPPGGGVPPGEG